MSGMELLHDGMTLEKKLLEECCAEMFKYWLEVDSEANWNKLTDALKQTGQRSLAKKVKDVLQGIIIIYMQLCTVYIYKSYYKLKLFYHTVLVLKKSTTIFTV